MRLVGRAIAALVVCFIICIAAYGVNLAVGMHAQPIYSGTIYNTGTNAPVEIIRDARGVAHIRAQSIHDAMFAQGFAEGTDRLFQLDLLRRYVYGDLSEVLGKATLATDEESRAVPVRAIVAREWQNLSPQDRDSLTAFAQGINAAATRTATPPEFRALLYRFAPWQPQDALAVGFATTLDLIDSWNDVAQRTGREPLTDPCYDAPVTDGLQAAVRAHSGCTVTTSRVAELLDTRAPIGSNEWAAGAAHTVEKRALIANDPHLRLGIPGVWYLVEIAAPGYHVAGASLAGTPGVILGHNENIAWGATNGTVVSLLVFDAPKTLDTRNLQTESFNVRFGATVTKQYYRDARFFGTDVTDASGRTRAVLVDWDAYRNPISPLVGFVALDKAANMQAALGALRAYRGPTQNFELADSSGNVAYHLAGVIPQDPTWGTAIHPWADTQHQYADVPFDALPHVDPAPGAIVWTANNKMYGPSYHYRLSAAFGAPYRAARIAQLLAAKQQYDVAYFRDMQMDTLSLAERELAQRIVASQGQQSAGNAWQQHVIDEFAHWDGNFSPTSTAASAMFEIRRELVRTRASMVAAMLDSRRRQPPILASIHLNEAQQAAVTKPWSTVGAVTVRHSLAALGFSIFNGSRFKGNGDAYTVHVQNDGFSQSFRAVWDVGNWDEGGITIPQGESGLPGSSHYLDEADAWITGQLLPLPFSTAAVDRATVEKLTLAP